jgi:orotate phosphoribosyltransferase-like protein
MIPEMLYRQTLFRGRSLKRIAQYYLKFLPKEVDCLVSRGSSGCAIATAILLLSEKPLMHHVVRKENEETHGEFYTSPDKCMAIVDDFIDSGITIRKILQKVPKIKYVLVHHCNLAEHLLPEGIELITIR